MALAPSYIVPPLGMRVGAPRSQRAAFPFHPPLPSGATPPATWPALLTAAQPEAPTGPRSETATLAAAAAGAARAAASATRLVAVRTRGIARP